MTLVTKKICMAKDIGVHGNLFGGTLMAWIDEAAVAYAAEFCHTPSLVTLRIGEMIFNKPVKLNNHLRFYADVTELGISSVTITVEVRRYALHSADETDVCATSVTLVRIDEDGSPRPISETVRKTYAKKMNVEPVRKKNTEPKSEIDPGQVSDWFRWKSG